MDDNNKLIDSFIQRLLALEMFRGNTDIKNFLTIEGREVYRGQVNKGKTINAPNSGQILQLQQPLGIGRDTKVSSIKKAFQKQYVTAGKSRLFDYTRLQEAVDSLSNEDKRQLMDFSNNVLQGNSLRATIEPITYDVPIIEATLPPEPEPEAKEREVKERLSDESERLPERLPENAQLEFESVRRRIPRLIQQENQTPVKPRITPDQQQGMFDQIERDRELEDMRDRVQYRLDRFKERFDPNRPELKHNVLQPPRGAEQKLEEFGLEDLELGEGEDSIILAGGERIRGAHAIAEQKTILQQIVSDTFGRITNNLLPDLPAMLADSGNNVRQLEDRVASRTTSIMKALGYTGKAVLGIMVPLAITYAYNWVSGLFSKEDEEQKEPTLAPVPEGPPAPGPPTEPPTEPPTGPPTEPPEPSSSDEPDIKHTAKTVITPDGITVEPLVMTVAPDPKILQNTKKFEAYDPADQKNALLVANNDPADDVIVSREALFSFRRDVLGSVDNNALLRSNMERDIVRYSDMTLRASRGFIEGENDVNQFDAIWIDTPGRVNDGSIAKFTPKPTVQSLLKGYRGEPAITMPKAAFIEPDFKTHETRFYGPNGSRNDPTAPFFSPLNKFSDVAVLNPSKSRLFGQTEPFV